MTAPTCTHEESLWGRCVFCGRTWGEQARDRGEPEADTTGWSSVTDDTSDLHSGGYHATIDYTNAYTGLPWRVTDAGGNVVGDGIATDENDAHAAAEYAIIAHQGAQPPTTEPTSTEAPMPTTRTVPAADLQPGDVITGYARQYDGHAVTAHPTEQDGCLVVELDNGDCMYIDALDAPIPVTRRP